MKQAVAVKSQLQQIARAIYSNPPVHGVLLVSKILSDPQTKALWFKEVKVVYILSCLFSSLFSYLFPFEFGEFDIPSMLS